MHTYTHPFIPIHTYNNTQQIMLLLNLVLQICNFLLKTYPTEMALAPIFFYNQNLAMTVLDLCETCES